LILAPYVSPRSNVGDAVSVSYAARRRDSRVSEQLNPLHFA
jgi:hypothetical protein